MKRVSVALTLLLLVLVTAVALSAQSGSPFNAIESQLDKVLAKLAALETALDNLQPPPPPPPKTTTNLLFTFVNTDPGFDTGIAISNTSNTTGNCTLHFFGRGVGA